MFFNWLWLHLGSQNDSKIYKKSIKNLSKNLFRKIFTSGIDFSSILNGFGIHLNLKKPFKTIGGVAFFMILLVLLQDRFQDVFWHRLCIDFSSILGPKSSKIRSNIYLKTCSEKYSLLGPNFHRFLMDLGPSLTWKSSKNAVRGIIFHVFATSTSRSIPRCFWHRFCIDFSSIWVPKSIPKCFKNLFKTNCNF